MPLSNHSKQVLVIGAGIVGLTTAYALQKQNYRITLVAPNDISERASSAAACLIGGSAVVPWASTTLWAEIPSMLLKSNSPLKLSLPFPAGLLSFFIQSHRAGNQSARDTSAAGLAQLGLSGLENWMTLLQDLPEAAALFRQTGCYFLYTNAAHREADEKNCSLRRSFGMALEEHNETELPTLLPDLKTPTATAVNVTKAAHVRDPIKLQQFLKTRIQENGGDIVDATVTDFDTEGSRVKSVVAGGRTLQADTVVIAAGYGSKSLAEKLNSGHPAFTLSRLQHHPTAHDYFHGHAVSGFE